ncbi:tRNA(Ile)-lysidine synthase [Ulvibacter sp. MAR_2010_11]|uniref:tRNA lysidine(34) synthetase TilS n=1 Tax=Ulvibacter sp. MAR_2010_11 TaxID=1250229 RepID=UPI000C2CDE7B|nr:tRNA lysidine(34) synthetase TilS [Ulvibacter sp. MAR_2010_11]PKA84445.1 tRNA(Ile)-lysidine synthase [Ulvibacter sp. MAR_2010_11]
MIQKFRKHIDKNHTLLKGKKILVACSGGLDSVVLTHLLKLSDYDISLAHCNFSLRGKESDEDEQFVVHLADKFSIPVFTETFDTKKYGSENKLSTQMAARELRYRWFDEIKRDFKLDYIVTAHHADDDLETFLINISRGTGLRGLTGIPAVNESVVRPLLPFSRNEILKHAKENHLHWREDSSNKKSDYWRNALRLEVIPKYKEASNNLLQSFQKTQEHLQESQLLIDDYMALIYNLVVTEMSDGYRIDSKRLQELPNTNAVLYELLVGFGFTAWEDISELVKAQSGKQIVSKTHRLLKDRDTLLLTQITSEAKKTEYFIEENDEEIDNPIHITLKSTKKIGNSTPTEVYVDKDKISFPLQLRKWREGDVFQPFGMQGKKKLSKFFKDEKLSLVAKEKIWLLCTNHKIVWIVGMRLDDRFKVTPDTKHILKITNTP